MKGTWLIAGAALVSTAIGCERSVPGGKAVEIDTTGGAGSFEGRIFADSYQIYLHDAATAPVFIDSWNNQTIADKLAVAKRALAFCPMREMEVAVKIVVQPAAPKTDLAAWDHVVEGSIELASGRLAVLGPMDAQPAAVFRLPAGWYRARICGGGFASIAHNGVDGDDRYEVVLWPASEAPVRVLKAHKPHD